MFAGISFIINFCRRKCWERQSVYLKPSLLFVLSPKSFQGAMPPLVPFIKVMLFPLGWTHGQDLLQRGSSWASSSSLDGNSKQKRMCTGKLKTLLSEPLEGSNVNSFHLEKTIYFHFGPGIKNSEGNNGRVAKINALLSTRKWWWRVT